MSLIHKCYSFRQCGDGHPHHNYCFQCLEAIYYAACISQVVVKVFFALVALLDYIIYDLDTINGFGQAGSLFQLIYLEMTNNITLVLST